MGMSRKIKVLIVDDSALIRMLLSKALSSSEDIEVVGTAEDPFVARDLIKKFNPDVLTLDIEMPKMDGITFLKNLMRLRPMPVVMISTLTKKGANVTLKALEYGAVDFVAKPDSDIKENLQAYSNMLIDKVKAAAKANVGSSVMPEITTTRKQQKPVSNLRNSKYDVIAIGASTGGTEAIKTLMVDLPADLPPIVMAQHIPPVFSTSFAKRLNTSTDITVHESLETMELLPGHAYLAPGDMHMKVVRRGGRLYTELDDGEPVNRHKPSVDVLYDSIRKTSASKCLSIILTGMGADGAQGMKRLKELGAHTIAQDEASSVVWGMPGATVQMGGAVEVLSLEMIANRIISLVYTK